MSDRVTSDRVANRTFYGGLLVIVGLGAVARFWQAGESLWLDELHTSWVVSGTFDEIARRARIGNQSPLYFYLVRGSTLLLGSNEMAIRLPSLMAGIGLMVAVGSVMWRWCGVAWAGWLAAGLVAVDHNMIFFAQEARPYALVQLVAWLQLAAFWRLQSTVRWRDRLLVTGGWVLMFYLHYTTLLLVTGELLWWSAMQFWQRGRGGYRPSQVLADVAIVVLASVPVWSHLADIAARRTMWELFIVQVPPWVALRWFHWELYLVNAVIVCSLVMVLNSARWRIRTLGRQRGAEIPSWIAVVPLLVCWWTVAVLIAWSLTTSDLARVFFPRYLIGVAVAPMACAGLCLTACRGPRSRAFGFLAIMALAVYGNGIWSQYHRDGRLITDRRQDWRGAITWLNAQRHDASPVLVRSGLIEADRLGADASESLREYCLLPVTSLYPIWPAEGVTPLRTSHSGRLSERTQGPLRQHRGGWFVISARAGSHEAMQRDLRESLPDCRLEILQEQSFGDVAVWQVRCSQRGASR